MRRERFVPAYKQRRTATLPDRPISVSTSMDIKLALLQHFGISATYVGDVELDLSDTIAHLKVTFIAPAFVNGLITQDVRKYELVERLPEAQG